MAVVLLLSPYPDRLSKAWEENDDVVATDGRCDAALIDDVRPDFVVSYGCRYLVPALVLERMGGRAVNLHTSLLPWNRGADPNLWSWLAHTPKGVSVHSMTPEIDRGPLIGQREVAFASSETLRSSYDRLQAEVQALFAVLWPAICVDEAPVFEQVGPGSSHRSADKEPHLRALVNGWDTSCADVQAYGRMHNLWTKP